MDRVGCGLAFGNTVYGWQYHIWSGREDSIAEAKIIKMFLWLKWYRLGRNQENTFDSGR